MMPEGESRHASAHTSHPTDNRHRRAFVLAQGPFGGGDHLWGGRIFTAEQLMAEQLPPVRWSVPGVLPEGLSVLAGKLKTGKGWLVLGVGVAIATGLTLINATTLASGDEFPKNSWRTSENSSSRHFGE